MIQASGTFPLLFVGHLNQVAAKNTAAASLHRVITPWEQTILAGSPMVFGDDRGRHGAELSPAVPQSLPTCILFLSPFVQV